MIRRKNKVIRSIGVLIFSLPLLLNGQDKPSISSVAAGLPVSIPITLSGNFGEPRSNHFHSGIDIRTNGVTGIPVKSIGNGFISRIKVEAGGYGKALYVVHPDGYISVYAHLQSFTDPVARYVKAEQYRRESFAVDLFPESQAFPVREGQVIAWSGNSGSSEGPHLHFEMRETQTENPVNPLIHSHILNDNTRPVAVKIFSFPLKSHKEWIKPVVMALQGSNGIFRPVNPGPLALDNTTGLGLLVYDLIDGSGNRCGVYRLQAFLDKQLFFEAVLDEFSFAETRYVNSFIDTKWSAKERSPVIRLFLEPNNQASVYRFAKNRGIIELNDDKPHNLEILVDDASGNRSTVVCQVKLDPGRFVKDPDFIPVYSAWFNYAETNRYVDEGIQVTLPQGTLYDNLYFQYQAARAVPGSYSRMHRIHRPDVPVHQYYRLAIEPTTLPEDIKPKAIIAQYEGSGEFTAIGGTWEGDWLVTRTRNFGTFCICVDTLPPVIKPLNYQSGTNISGVKTLRFNVKDDFSGIQKFRGEIDGQWILLEHDPKNDLLEYQIDPERITSKGQHRLAISVWDQLNNKAEFTSTFIR